MNIETRITASKEYYIEFYSEWLKRSKLKKWEPFLATALLFFGVGLYYYNTNPNLRVIPIFFIIAGIYELFKSYYSRKKWLSERVKSNILNKEIILTFNEENIKHEGPFFNGTLKWEGIKSWILTDNGLFLIPENGISIYIPKNSFSTSDEINQVINKIKQHRANHP
jgi:hypothetical protein